MIRPVSIGDLVLACLADCPADNHARQLAQFLYETLETIKTQMLRNLTYLILIPLLLGCEPNHMFKKLENDKVVFIGLDKYGLDSIPPEIGKLKNVEELIIAQDSTMGWTIYPPASAMSRMVDIPPHKTLPDELTELKSLKKLNISGLNIRTLPTDFGHLKNLEYLDISMNKLDIKMKYQN